jgi:hypothetical protein
MFILIREHLLSWTAASLISSHCLCITSISNRNIPGVLIRDGHTLYVYAHTRLPADLNFRLSLLAATL